MFTSTERSKTFGPILWAFFFLLSLSPAQSGFGQIAGSIPDLAIELSPRVFYDYDNEAYYGQLMYSRIASSIQIANPA